MKKEFTAIICIVLAVWFFFMGFEIGIYKERKSNEKTTDNVVTVPAITSTTATTQAPTESQPDTTVPPTDAPDTTEAEPDTTSGNDDTTTTKAEKKKKKNDDPSSMSTEEIIAEMKKAYNGVLSEQNFTAKKHEKVTINLTDLSVQSLLNMVNSVIQNLAKDENETYTFVNGVGTGVDGDGKELGNDFNMEWLLPPDDKAWDVAPEGVKTATATKDGDNTVYKIVLNPEDTTFTDPIPKYSSTVFGYLDLTSLDISALTITDANMHYDGTEVTITVNGDGKMTEIHYFMPMNGYGQGKAVFVTGDASFEGSDDETWTFTY